MTEPIWNALEVAPRSAVTYAVEQFANTLTETVEYHNFEQAYYAFRQDEEAQNALRDFQEKQASFNTLIQSNTLSEEGWQTLEELRIRVLEHTSVVQYTEAQEKLAALCQQVGDLLSEAIGLDFSASCKTGGCCG